MMSERIQKVMLVSTAHLSAPVALEEMGYYESMSSEYGWLVSTHMLHRNQLQDVELQLPACLTAVLALAQEMGCTYVLFDRDVEPLPQLEVHDW